jgi:Chaperone of endosialidase/Head domain of trimeric autotransporter adhesin
MPFLISTAFHSEQTKYRQMKKIVSHFMIICAIQVAGLMPVQAQNVGIGTQNPAYSAALEVSSNNKGLLIPRLTTAQKLAIDTPVNGLLIYQTDAAAGFWYYNGATWRAISNGAAFFCISPYDQASIIYNDMPDAYGKNFLLNADSINYNTSGPIGSLQPKQFFLPGKQGAFRAGAVTGNVWNIDSIGNASFAAGYDTKATKPGTVAMGTSSQATGNWATALGYNTQASDMAATALGNFSKASAAFATAMGNTTNASGVAATAMGEYTTASGQHSLAGGSDTQATGSDAVAFGQETTAGGATAFATGSGTTASGDASVAAGFGALASGHYAMALGAGAQASGLSCVAMGFEAKASGTIATAIGYKTEATGQKATSMGELTVASGIGATAMGGYTAASGGYATAMGYYTDATGSYATATGYNTLSSGNFTFTAGNQTKASGFAATAMGSLSNATGYYALATGAATQALGEGAVSLGGSTIATGNYTIAAGQFTRAKSFSEMVIGRYNDTLLVTDAELFKSDSNRVFTVGIGGSPSTRKTAFVIQQDGMVGIGVRRPEALLHINGDVMVNGDNFIELGANAAGKQVDAGKIGYATFTPATLDIVGGGNTQAQRKIKFWAEGGAVFAGAVNATAFNVASDGRFKRDIQPIHNPLNRLMQLRGVSYYFNRQQFAERAFPEILQYGFVAQEVEQVLPHAVQTGSDGYKAVNYTELIPLLTESIKAQQRQIKQLLQQTAALQKQVRELTKKLAFNP